MCGRAELIQLLGHGIGTRRHGQSAPCCSHTAARGEEDSLLETVTVRLRGFGECMFYSFLKCPGVLYGFYCSRAVAGRAAQQVSPLPVSRSPVGTSRAPEGLTPPPPEASCSISFPLSHHQITGGYFLSPSMSDIPMLWLKLESWARTQPSVKHSAEALPGLVLPWSGSAG